MRPSRQNGIAEGVVKPGNLAKDRPHRAMPFICAEPPRRSGTARRGDSVCQIVGGLVLQRRRFRFRWPL